MWMNMRTQRQNSGVFIHDIYGLFRYYIWVFFALAVAAYLSLSFCLPRLRFEHGILDIDNFWPGIKKKRLNENEWMCLKPFRCYALVYVTLMCSRYSSLFFIVFICCVLFFCELLLFDHLMIGLLKSNYRLFFSFFFFYDQYIVCTRNSMVGT